MGVTGNLLFVVGLREKDAMCHTVQTREFVGSSIGPTFLQCVSLATFSFMKRLGDHK